MTASTRKKPFEANYSCNSCFNQMNFLKLIHTFLLQANAFHIKLTFALHFPSRGEVEPHSDVIIIRVLFFSL